jgi:hypothetical protein
MRNRNFRVPQANKMEENPPFQNQAGFHPFKFSCRSSRGLIFRQGILPGFSVFGET